MEQLIQFRFQVEQLDENEWKMFMHQLAQAFNKNDLLSWIFCFFHQSHLNKQNNDSSLISMQNIISNIVDLRKKSKNHFNITKQSSNKEIKINDLPSTMIQECASYLYLCDYINFSKTSRLMYVSCNTPSKLQEINLVSIRNISQCNLDQFKFLKTIELHPLSFNKYIQSHPLINNLNNLKELMIDNKGRSDFNDISQFMHATCIDFNKIKYFECRNVGNKYDGLMDFDKFCIFLGKFPNVIELSLSDIYLTANNNGDNDLPKLFPELQILNVDGLNSDSVHDLQNILINKNLHQMVQFHYNDFVEIDSNIITLPDKLKELIVTNSNINAVNHLIKMATHLEAIAFDIKHQASINTDQMKDIIDSILTNYAKMRYIQICIDFTQFDDIIEYTEIALLNANRNKKKELTLRYDIMIVKNYDIPEKEKIKLLISRIVHSLDCSQIDSFMVICSIMDKNGKSLSQKDPINNYFIQQFKFKYLVFNEIIKGAQQMVICNNDCTINGLRFDWVNCNDLEL